MISLAVMVAAMLGSPALACDSYKSMSQDQAQKLLEVIANKAAKQLDRVFAFETLVCADVPAVREYAKQEGLKAATDPVTRGQVLLEILMQMEHVRIDFIDNPSLPKQDRDWIAGYKGSYLYNISYRDRVRGCLSLSSKNECNQDYQFKIRGTKVELYNGSVQGLFELQSDNSLRGYVRRDNKSTQIPTKIELF